MVPLFEPLVLSARFVVHSRGATRRRQPNWSIKCASAKYKILSTLLHLYHEDRQWYCYHTSDDYRESFPNCLLSEHFSIDICRTITQHLFNADANSQPPTIPPPTHMIRIQRNKNHVDLRRFNSAMVYLYYLSVVAKRLLFKVFWTRGLPKNNRYEAVGACFN